MEDVLKVYHRGFDDGPVPVCKDESSKQLTRQTRAPLPTRLGQPAIYDFEYERNAAATPVDWRFRTVDAHLKLKSLFPTIPC
ncbi:MAG: hypothetical protein OXC26_26365 [Albidovulum sp.]|nr:hypothetical protein [Albidovulum sp.]